MKDWEAGEVEWNLVCPFLDESNSYAAGVELGLLYADMKKRRKISGYFMKANQEQITLLVNRTGWLIVKMESHDDDWFYVKMKRKGG